VIDYGLEGYYVFFLYMANAAKDADSAASMPASNPGVELLWLPGCCWHDGLEKQSESAQST
jgi:hypothetical protein